jgi:hypothetical protein
MTPPPSDYQTDQLRRLNAYVSQYGRPLPVVWRVGAPESDVPPVWRELDDLGLVKVARLREVVVVKPVELYEVPA